MSIKDLVDGFVNQVTGRPEQALRDGNAALIELGMAAAAFGLSYLFENINRRGR